MTGKNFLLVSMIVSVLLAAAGCTVDVTARRGGETLRLRVDYNPGTEA